MRSRRSTLAASVVPAVGIAAALALPIGLLFWRCIVMGEAFVPATQARYLAPWSAHQSQTDRPPWNPLHYDSVGQFHCWAEFSAREIREGRLPLWNPYQMCGAPFVANSQSAVYYPLNALRPMLGPARAAGWLAALHLLVAAALTYGFMRSVGASRAASAVAGITYSISSWQIAWLHLPTFAAASCWLPGILLGLRLIVQRGPASVAALAAAIAMSLLAGHLQITLYCLICAACYGIYLALSIRGVRAVTAFVGRALAALVIGLLVASPQLLPAAELSRRSHRIGKPTSEGYKAYVAYAVHPAALATLAHPDAFGNPANADAPYIGFSRGGMYFNYAEGAMYVGLLPLLLAAVGVTGLRRGSPFPLLLAAGALFIAVGTPLAMALYFGIPGFSQSGSPGRVLVLWSFGMAWLAGIGVDVLCRHERSPRQALLVVPALGIVLAMAVSYASGAARETLGTAALQWPDTGRQLGLAALAIACIVLPFARHRMRAYAPPLMAIVAACDLLAHGASYNATSRIDEELRATETIERLQASLGHDRFAPINHNWSFMGPTASLPPNFGALFAIRDVQGYDSLMPGQYKRWLLDKVGADPSPPEVGNMLFLRAPKNDVLDACGVRMIVSAAPLSGHGNGTITADGLWLYRRHDSPSRVRANDQSGQAMPVRWLRDTPNAVRIEAHLPNGGTLRLSDQRWPGWTCRVDGRPTPIAAENGIFRSVSVERPARVFEFRYEPATTRLGHYLMALSASIIACLAGLGLMRGAVGLREQRDP